MQALVKLMLTSKLPGGAVAANVGSAATKMIFFMVALK